MIGHENTPWRRRHRRSAEAHGILLEPGAPAWQAQSAGVRDTGLHFTAENADQLRAALLRAAASGDAQPAASDQYGDRYVLEFEIEGPQAAGIVRSTWIVRRGESAPRLTSCFVK
jgi:hypothetical protein